ncbi:MAG: aspartate kinase [Oscillospiraceae bacterium]|nr:aspartate kinase [Oscillospiraceae bacterium]
MLTVVKFGGSSLADAGRIQNAARRIAALFEAGHQVVAVVSAQGDTTDDMIEKAAQIHTDPPKREMDAYLAAGEQMSAALMAMALHKMGLPAISLTGMQAGLMTDGVHSDARVLGLRNDRVRQELDKGNIVVVAGFQGVDGAGDITTLGRGGSDTTAVALAAFLQAAVCKIYTDVDGVYDRDPRKFPDAVKLPWIGYDEMLQLARQGAQVLHDRCVELAQMYNVPVQVLSSFRPGEGTFITALPEDFPQI